MGWAAWCLQHRGKTTLAALVFFVGSFSMVPFLPTGFLPPDDLSQTQVYLTLPPGSTFQQTLAAAEQARHIVQKHPQWDNVWIAGGGSGHGFKHGPVVGEYVARRVAGQDAEPELEALFRIKPETFPASVFSGARRY